MCIVFVRVHGSANTFPKPNEWHTTKALGLLDKVSAERWSLCKYYVYSKMISGFSAYFMNRKFKLSSERRRGHMLKHTIFYISVFCFPTACVCVCEHQTIRYKGIKRPGFDFEQLGSGLFSFAFSLSLVRSFVRADKNSELSYWWYIYICTHKHTHIHIRTGNWERKTKARVRVKEAYI